MAAIHASQHAARAAASYQRAHEEAADRAAVKFLAATGQSAKGMYRT
jgi:predicted Zn-dependent protease